MATCLLCMDDEYGNHEYKLVDSDGFRHTSCICAECREAVKVGRAVMDMPKDSDLFRDVNGFWGYEVLKKSIAHGRKTPLEALKGANK